MVQGLYGALKPYSTAVGPCAVVVVNQTTARVHNIFTTGTISAAAHPEHLLVHLSRTICGCLAREVHYSTGTLLLVVSLCNRQSS